MQFRPISQMLR